MVALAILLGLLPGVAWLFFYLREDMHPEPPRTLALAFINGAAFAFLALLVELVFDGVRESGGFSSLNIGFLFLFAGIEEFIKFIATYLTVHNRPEFDEPIDAMVYIVVAALGFATVENIGVVSSGGAGSLVAASIFQVITFRFIGATLLHTLSSGIMGYHWALGIAEFGHPIRQIVKGLLYATALHTIFNVLVLKYGSALYSLVLLTVAGLFVLADFEKLKKKMV